MKQIVQAGIHQRAQGFVRVLVVDSKTKQVKRDYGWQKNLILNQGMENLAVLNSYWANMFYYAAAGSGTTPTNDDSGLTQVLQSGTTVTLSGGSYRFTDTATNGGHMIKWDTGQEARIISVSSTTQATVANSATVASGEFTIYRTSQTGLVVELKRTSNWLTGSGNCGTVIDLTTGLLKMRRTFDFSAEAGTVTYSEVGFSSSSNVANNLFSRVRLASDVVCNSGDQLRVIYELQLTVGPVTQRSISPVITGWSNTTAVEIMTALAVVYVDVSGNNTNAGQLGLDPAFIQNEAAYYSNSTAALPVGTLMSDSTNYGGSVSSGPAYPTLDTYIPMSFTLTRSIVWGTSVGNVAGIRTIVLGYFWNPGTTPFFVVRFDNAQTKTNVTTLTLKFRFTWSRVLA